MLNPRARRDARERSRAYQNLDHAQEHEVKNNYPSHEYDQRITSNSISSSLDHDLATALKIKMQQIQNFVGTDAECVFALKHYNGLEKGVLVNACKSLGTSEVKKILLRVRGIRQDRIRQSKGEYLTGALKMEVRSKRLEWGEWDCSRLGPCN